MLSRNFDMATVKVDFLCERLRILLAFSRILKNRRKVEISFEEHKPRYKQKKIDSTRMS